MWIPTQGLHWQYQLQGKFKHQPVRRPGSGGACVRPNVYDVDLYARNGVTLDTAGGGAIHALGATPCATSTPAPGRDFRPDAGPTRRSVKGRQRVAR